MDSKKRDIINFILLIAMIGNAVVTVINGFFYMLNWSWLQYTWACSIGICILIYILKSRELAVSIMGFILLVASLFYIETLPVKISWSFTLGESIFYKSNPIYCIMFLIYLFINRKILLSNTIKLAQWIYKILPGE